MLIILIKGLKGEEGFAGVLLLVLWFQTPVAKTPNF
jgi:hypothetical protein